MKSSTYYPLTSSQDVSYLQCKYTLYKQVVNILSSVTIDNQIDFDLMQKSYDYLLDRHDCLGIKFFKKKGQLVQRFDKPIRVKVPLLTFSTKEEQDAFIATERKKAIDYKHGVIIEPFFIKTFDKKNMVFFKVCHMALDIYGITVLYKDLLSIYHSLETGAPLPEAPNKFEDVVKKDLQRKFNKDVQEKNRKFFTDLFQSNPEPYYAGIHGEDDKIWQKQLRKNKRAMPIFFVNNQTKDYCYKIDKKITSKIMNFCTENEYSPATFLFYVYNLTTAKVNGNRTNLLPLAIYNCRTSALEKNCSGSKVQSLGCYSTIDYDQTFTDSFKTFMVNQFNYVKHLGFPDRDFEMLVHKSYRSSWLTNYYSYIYSFLPITLPEGVRIDVYSNERCAVPVYLAQLYNVNVGEIETYYDVQTKIINEKHVKDFHQNYLTIMEQIINDPNIILSQIKF